MKIFQPRQGSLALHLGEDQEEGASLDSSLLCYAMLLLVLHCSSTKGPMRPKTTFRSVVPIDVLGALTNRGRPNKEPVDAHPLPKLMQLPQSLSSPRRRPQEGSAEGLEQPVLQQMPVASSGKFSGEIREEEELEESAESERTAAVEATRRATERAARIRAALGATLEKSPLVTAALRRAAQAKAGRETAKDEVAVELQIKDKPKAATEL